MKKTKKLFMRVIFESKDYNFEFTIENPLFIPNHGDIINIDLKETSIINGKNIEDYQKLDEHDSMYATENSIYYYKNYTQVNVWATDSLGLYENEEYREKEKRKFLNKR